MYDRVIQLDMATTKARQSVKQLAGRGDVKSARILAKEVVRSNKQKDRLSVSKARLGSIGLQLSHQLGGQVDPCSCSSFHIIFSIRKSYRVTTEVDRNHEAFQCSH